MLILGLIPIIGMSTLSAFFWTATNESIQRTESQSRYLQLSAQILDVESKIAQATASSQVAERSDQARTFPDQAQEDRETAIEAIDGLRSSIDEASELLAPVSAQGSATELTEYLDSRLAIAQTILESPSDPTNADRFYILDNFSVILRPLWEASVEATSSSSVENTSWSSSDRTYVSTARYEQAWMAERANLVTQYLDGTAQDTDRQEQLRTEAFDSILGLTEFGSTASRLANDRRVDPASNLSVSVPEMQKPMEVWTRQALAISTSAQHDIGEATTRSVDIRNQEVGSLKVRRTLIVVTAIVVAVLAVSLFQVSRNEIEHRRSVERAHKKALIALDDRARRDPATGMWNRRQLNDELTACLEKQETEGPVVLIYIDLDRFKPINDIWGHAMGDRILQAVSDRLRGSRFEGYSAVRFGGDEFILLGNQKNATIESALKLGNEVIETISQPVAVADQQFSISATAGVTVSDLNSTSEQLLLEADTVLILSKRNVRGTANSYDRAKTRSSELLKTLPEALENGEITCEFQPIYELESGRLHHVEALARWTRTDGSTIPPSEFVPIIESFGLTTELTARVICEVANFMKTPGFPQGVNIWFNVSAKEFENAQLANQVLEAIDSHGLDPSRLGMEVTETAAVADSDTFNAVSSKLRERNMSVAIDDFGAGHSPLGMLFELEVDVIKLDRKLIESVDTNPRMAAIVGGIVTALQNSSIETIAEGVETTRQLLWLRTEGVDYVQGYLLARPMRPEVLLANWGASVPKKQRAL